MLFFVFSRRLAVSQFDSSLWHTCVSLEVAFALKPLNLFSQSLRSCYYRPFSYIFLTVLCGANIPGLAFSPIPVLYDSVQCRLQRKTGIGICLLVHSSISYLIMTFKVYSLWNMERLCYGNKTIVSGKKSNIEDRGICDLNILMTGKQTDRLTYLEK